jgi:anaerobic magnesium-protoporphyrin IX monomethyl ester cyclase
VVEHGDLEAGVATYLRWLSGTDNPNHPGVAVRTKTGWQEGGLGLFLPPEQWQLPDVKEIPYSDYGRMYRRDQNKFCGIPERRELVVPAARGCPINCAFCEVSTFQGRRDRRLTVERTVKYIEDSFAAHPFEYVAFYAPTFTLDRRWIVRLCDQLIDRNAPYPWKCATAIAYLDDELLALMAQSGCIRVSVGLETLDPDGHGALPRRKRIDRFHHLAEQCRALEIELNCFVIVGLPGTTIEGTGRTIQEIRDVGGRVRPTIYSSMASLRAAETLEQAAAFNRHLIPSAKSHDSSEVHLCYGFLFGREDWTTPVMSRIPEHAGRLE